MIERRDFLKRAVLGLLTCPSFVSDSNFIKSSKKRPAKKRRYPQNFIIILIDDLGYGDLSCYGNTKFSTPNLDQMAKEGIRFTDFYACAPMCTPTRASIITGCYPQRVGLPKVLNWRNKVGINPHEITIAELAKKANYKTACYGKWHLGHLKPFLPIYHGFDEYYGLPYSNDMGPLNKPDAPPLPLIEGDKTVEYNPDQSKLTTAYTERAIDFIKRNKDNPFFLYLPHTMVHVPLFVSDRFKGKSGAGLYGDVVQEIDWSTGEILNTIKNLGLYDNTLILFTSDNGPWLLYGEDGGCAGPLKCGKGTTFEGGMRVPFIAWAPGFIPEGKVCKEVSATFDFYPTFAEIIDIDIPQQPIRDGKSIWHLLTKPENKSPHDFFLYFLHDELQAIRSGKWKLHYPHKYQDIEVPGKEGLPGKYTTKEIELSLFNLEDDIGERNNIAKELPMLVKKLKDIGIKFRNSLMSNTRPPGTLA